MNNIKDIKNIPYFREELNKLNDLYSEYIKSEIPVITDELFNIYYKTGSRKEYEDVYFTRRKMLTVYALKCMIYGTKYKTPLEDIIEAVCCEKTWALPPHIPKGHKAPAEVIDLFSAETGHTLSEIYYRLKDVLSDKTKKIIYDETERRIVKPFLNNTFGWENAENNWSAVCGGSVGMTFLYLFDEVFKKAEKRINNAMQAYLKGFGDDGISNEGLGYWDYGMRYFSGYAYLYKTKCGINLFENPKVREVAKCQQNLFISENETVSFSDCVRNEKFDSALACFFREIYGDEIKILSKGISYTPDPCGRFLPALRNFLWNKPSAYEKNNIGTRFFKNCQWYINVGDKFAFAAKAGNNGESHNHNDVGGFIVAVSNGQLIADYGAGAYTKEYFSDRRYDILCNSSRGHSVPIIDGTYQRAGANYKGEVITVKDNIFEIDISGAYDTDKLKSLNRRFQMGQNGIIMEDTFLFADEKIHDVTERFISVVKPKLTEEGVKIGELLIKCEQRPQISDEVLISHDGMEEKLYFTDYKYQIYGKLYKILYNLLIFAD